MIKVLEVIDSLYAGGAESLLKNFLIEAKKYPNFHIDVATLYSRNIFVKELQDNNIEVFNMNLLFKYDFLKMIRFIRLVKKEKYNIIHVHLFPADLFVAIASIFLPKNIVYIFSEHSIYNRRRSLRIFRFIDEFTYSRYKKIVCVSESVKTALNKYLPQTTSKSIVIKNAIPVSKDIDFVNLRKHYLYDVLFVGRLEHAKGVDVFLKAILHIKENYGRNVKVAIVGDGSKKEYLKGLVDEYKISPSVEFLGIRKDVKELMNVSKIFVLSSRWEGLPMVILEAMANGIPIIATDVGGIGEVIENKVNGIIVPKEDSEALASKIVELLDNEIFRLDLAKNAFEKVKRDYSIEQYTLNIVNLYKELVGG